ncbi:MAG: hypothetical protein R3E96_15610 [Planctomycetota bacterium]
MQSESEPLTQDLLEWALPVLVHRINNQTQWITGYRALLGLTGAEELLESKSPELARTGSELTHIGWLLAVLASARGGNLLLSRREPEGLRWIVGLVEEGLRRNKAGSFTGPATLPLLQPGALDGWQVPVALGRLLWTAAHHSGGGTWNLERTGEGWSLEVPWPAGESIPGFLHDWLPDARIESASPLRLTLPADWLLAP